MIGAGDTDRHVTSILIVDDHPIVRQGLRMLIEDEPDMQVCGEAATAEEANAMVASLKPDVALVDLCLEQDDGMDVIRRAASGSGARMIVVSSREPAIYAGRALRAGAMGFVSKIEVVETLVEAIRQVCAGRRYVSPLAAESVDGWGDGDRQSRNDAAQP